MYKYFTSVSSGLLLGATYKQWRHKSRDVEFDASMKGRKTSEEWLQTTQPTNGGAVTADSGCCANGVELSRPQQ